MSQAVLGHSKCSVHSVHVPVSASQAGFSTLHVEVPPNTTATIYVPAQNTEMMRESGKTLAEAGLKGTVEQGYVVLTEVGSGSYDFQF